MNEKELETNEYVREVMKELEVRFSYDLLRNRADVDPFERSVQSWEWQYGQSPEFTHEMKGIEMVLSPLSLRIISSVPDSEV